MNKILLVSPQLVIGGSEKVLIGFADNLITLGYEVHILLINDIIELPVPEDIKIHKAKIYSWLRIKYLREKVIARHIAQLDRQFDFSVIISNFITTRSWLKKTIESKTYYCVHFDYKLLHSKYKKLSHAQLRKFENKIYNYFNGRNLISVSMGAPNTLSHDFQVIPKAAYIIHNSFDFKKLRANAQEYTPPLAKPYIIHVARFDLENKRQDLLLESFEQVSTNISLVLITQINDILLEMVNQSSKRDKIILVPFMANPYPWISRAKLLILCSDSEAFGNVIVEALALNTPVISTNCPSGPSEILGDNMQEWLVEPNNSTAIAIKIDQYLNHPEKYIIDQEQLERFSSVKAEHKLSNLIKNHSGKSQ